MAAQGSTANSVFVTMPPNTAGVIQQGQGVSSVISQTPQMVQGVPQHFRVMNTGNQHLGATYLGSQAERVTQLSQEGTMEVFLKSQLKILGAIQILTGLLHIGFGVVPAFFSGTNYTSISVVSGYPFWGGLIFVISGSLSVAAENQHNLCLVRGSLGMNITSAIFSVIGIILFLTELGINQSDVFDNWLAGLKVNVVMLLFCTILEFSIAILNSHFGCQAVLYTPNAQAVRFIPYTGNANVGVPSTSVTHPPTSASMTHPPTSSN